MTRNNRGVYPETEEVREVGAAEGVVWEGGGRGGGGRCEGYPAGPAPPCAGAGEEFKKVEIYKD